MENLPGNISGQYRSIPSFTDASIARVWNFWFANRVPNTNAANTDAFLNPYDSNYKFHNTLWFNPTSHFIDQIRTQFEPLIQKAAHKELDKEWKCTARGRLGLVLLLDGFARHLHRDTAKEFECSAIALEVAQETLNMHLEVSTHLF